MAIRATPVNGMIRARPVQPGEERRQEPLIFDIGSRLPAWANQDLAEPLRRWADQYVPDTGLRQRDLALQLEQIETSRRNRLGGGSLPAGIVQARPMGSFDAQARNAIGSQLMSGDVDLPFGMGFLASAATSIPELFGMPAPIESEVFRIQNPWTGFASQLVGAGGVYGAAFKLSKVGIFSRATEGLTRRALAFTGTSEAASPLIAGGLREFFRYTPLELTRLGVGFTVWPENTDNLMGDVVMSQALAFTFGVGGVALRNFGQQVRQPRRQPGSSQRRIGMLPSFELRLLKDEAIPVEPGVDRAGLVQQFTRRVLTARPGQRTAGQDESIVAERAFWNLGLGEAAEGQLKRLFKVNGSRQTADTLKKSGLDVRFLAAGRASDTNRIPKTLQKQIFARFGFTDESDAAAAFVFPRVVRVTQPHFANRLATALDEAGDGVKIFADEGTFVARDGEGLWVFGTRVGGDEVKTTGKTLDALKAEHAAARAAHESMLTRQAESAGEAAEIAEELRIWDEANPAPTRSTLRTRKPKAHGKLGIAQGDYWVIGKTDRLDLVLPAHHKKFSETMATWATQNARFRPGVRDDVFNQWTDTILASMHHQDWQAVKNMTRASGVARIASRAKQQMMETTGLVDSVALRELSEKIYDIMVPTARKEVSSPIYQRVYGLLKGVTQRADEIAGHISRGVLKRDTSPARAILNPKSAQYSRLWDDLEPVDELIYSLTDEEATLLGNATQVPGKSLTNALEELSESGLISDRARDVIRQLQEVNKRMIDEYVLPGLKSAGVEDTTKWLEGYIMPRLYRGDFYLDIKRGKQTVYRVSGVSGRETQAIAKALMEEAAENGQTWTVGELKQFNALDAGDDIFDTIFDALHPVGSSEKQVQDIVLGGLKRASAGRQGIPKVRAPNTLKERSDLRVNEQTWTKEELLKGIHQHNTRLLRYVANRTWHERWYPELAAWGEAGNAAMARDIERKAAQLSGIELGLSKSQNAHMREVFNLGGSQPLTKMVGMANSLMYNMMLGIFNLNFAMLNLMTPLMTTVPWISYMKNAPTYRQLQFMDTLPELNAAGEFVGVVNQVSTLKVFTQALRMMKNPDDAARTAMIRAIDEGALDAQLYENYVGGAASKAGASLRDSWHEGGIWELGKAIVNQPAIKSEQFGRLIAFNAAYALGRDVFGLAGEGLYRFAKKGVEQSMYGYHLVDRPRVLTAPVGSFVGLFKNWSFHYMNQMFDYAGLAVRDNVWAPSLWLLGTSAAVGGIGATPLKGVLDGLVRMSTDSESAFQWLQQNWHEEHPLMTDMVYFGLPAMVGASLQGSATMPGTDVVQDITQLGNIVAWERGKQLFTAMSKMNEYSSNTGQNAFTNANLRAEFIGAATPRAVARIYSVTEENAIVSMRTGYPTVKDIGPMTQFLYAAGMNQVEVDRYYVAGRELHRQQERTRSLITSMGSEYAQAREARDFQHTRRVMERAVMLGVPFDSVLRSAQSLDQRQGGDSLDRYDQQDVERYMLDR